MKNSLSLRIAKTAGVAAALVSSLTSSAHALTFDIATLTIDPLASADLGSNSMIVRTTSYSTVQGYVISGFAAFNWNGNGISSSNAATFVDPTALGIADNTDAFYATFNGISVGADDVFVRYTYYGDADLNGSVDNDDYALIDAGFSAASDRWFLGDFDYNGVIDNDDYALIDAGFSGQGAPLGGGGGFFVGGGKLSGSTVPEPTSVALLMIGALGFMGRRRR